MAARDKSSPKSEAEMTTSSGIALKSVYGPDDLEKLAYDNNMGDPGHFPYTRGIYETMYRGRLWTMRQYAGFGTAEESNARFKFLLEQGQTGLSVAFDLPTQLGLDSDDPVASEEVGKVGVAVDSLHDMEILFEGIPLNEISVSFTINATAPIILAMYVVLAENQGLEPKKLKGTMQNDILKEYIARGTWIFPPAPSLRLVTDVIEFCARNMPSFYPISICGYHIREAGSTAVQELAMALANAVAYIESALERGLDIDDFAPRLSFFLCVSIDLFEEVAKFRAARKIWAHVLRDRFQAKNPRSWLFRVGVGCAGSTLTAEQPLNNVVRVACEALTAALSGVQSLFTCAWDEPFAIPTEESAQLALRTQQILAYETGLTTVVDPLGGSYYLEHLTVEIENEVKRLMDHLEGQGGVVRRLESGYIQRLIASAAYRYQKAIEVGTKTVVGINSFQVPEHRTELSLYKPDRKSVRRQIQRLTNVKRNRDEIAVARALTGLRETAEADRNLMPSLINAVRSQATMGEMVAVLKSVFGEFTEPITA